jgi:hypothetical protein
LGFATKYQIGTLPPVDLNQAPWLKWVPGLQALAAAYQEEYAPLMDGLAAIRAEEHRLFGQRQIKLGRLFARFIREGYLSPDDIICTGGIGAIPYYSRLRTVDYYGLTDAVIARRKRSVEWRFIFHEKSPATSYLEERKVDFVIMVGPGAFLTSYRLFEGLPMIPAWGLDLRAWPSRLYMVEMDSWLLSFTSPHRPADLLERFQKQNLPIYLFVPEGAQAHPVPLAEALARFPELRKRPSPE